MNKKPYILFATLLAACSVDESFDVSMNEGKGSMTLAVEVSDYVDVTTTTRSATYTISADLVPAANDLKLEIYQRSVGSDNTTAYTHYLDYASVGDYDSPSMTAGDYTAVISSNGDISQESATNAFFADTVDFTVIKDESVTASMTATLANSIVRFQVSDSFNDYFAGGATLTLSTEAGSSIELDFPNANAYETILFVASNTALYIEGSAVKQDPGTGVAPSVTFSKTKIGVASPGEMNSITVDATDTGGADITVTIDDTIIPVSTTDVDVNSGDVTTTTVE